MLTLSATNGKFKIPPRDPTTAWTPNSRWAPTVKLAGLHPHMHGRGKDFEYRIVYPAGGTQTILRVPRYNWHWQLWYNLAEPLVLPKGARIECTAHFDNSPNNPDNAGSQQRSHLGRSELGRDDGRFLQSGVPG